MSIRRIADAIEYSVPAIYDHFENKEAILVEFGKEGFRLLTKKIQEAKEKIDDPAEQLRLIANAYRDFACKHKEHYQLMYGPGMQGCEVERCFSEKAIFGKLVMTLLFRSLKKAKIRKLVLVLNSVLFGLSCMV